MKKKLATEPKRAARQADLIYVNDDIPGYSRIKNSDGFSFLDESGQPIKNESEISRLKKLAIPPAYESVWICPLADGHLQFTARDVRGRKQYRYHERWRAFRANVNQERMVGFGQSLPKIREQIEKDLIHTKIDKTKVLAVIVKLMDMTLIRVGGLEYAKQNGSYGLTTMRDKHVKIEGAKIRFSFKGKSNQKHIVDVNNRKLAKIVRRCMEIPGYDLFQYYGPDGQHHPVRSQDVNDYLKEASGQEYTAKDFRTWWATAYCIEFLKDLSVPKTKKEAKQKIVVAIKQVAKKLGNTPAVCKKNYIYKGLLDSYEAGLLPELIGKFEIKSDNFMTPEEQIALHFLKKTVQ